MLKKLVKYIRGYFSHKRFVECVQREVDIAKKISLCNNGAKVLILRKNNDCVSIRWSEIKKAKQLHAKSMKGKSLQFIQANAIAIIENGRVVDISDSVFNYVKL